MPWFSATPSVRRVATDGSEGRRRDMAPDEPRTGNRVVGHGAGQPRDGLGVQRGLREPGVDLRERCDASSGVAGGQPEPGRGKRIIDDTVQIWVDFMRWRGG